MKFDLIIKDASLEEVSEVLAKINTGRVAYTAPLVIQETTEQELASESSEEVSSNEDVAGVVDKDGFPWDARIHSGNKKMTAKGVWTRRRGVTDLEVANVEAELRSNQNTIAAIVQSQPTQEPAFSAVQNGAAMPNFQQQEIPQQVQQFVNSQAIMQPVQIQPQFVPQVATAQAPAPAEEQITFELFLSKANQRLMEGKVDNNYLMKIAEKVGVTSMTEIARPDLLAYAVSVMKAEGLWY